MQKLGISILLGILTSSGALAQTVTKTNDINNPINHSYQQTVGSACSSSSNSCELLYPAITAPKTLVRHVSCIFVVKNSATSPNSIAFTIQSKGDVEYLQPFNLGANTFTPADTNFGVNGDTYLFINKGQIPRVVALLPSGTSFDTAQCTLTGYHSIAGQT